jgi:hypothetical protein
MEGKMSHDIKPSTIHRLDIQGFENISTDRLAEVAPWLRLAFGMCAILALAGTALGSPEVLWVLLPIAALAAAFPVHPFDLIYNHGIRHMTNTGPLPKRGAPARFACGMGAVWLAVTSWAFWSGHATTGYILGFSLASVATLVSTTDICIPSMIFRAIFGQPAAREKTAAS